MPTYRRATTALACIACHAHMNETMFASSPLDSANCQATAGLWIGDKSEEDKAMRRTRCERLRCAAASGSISSPGRSSVLKRQPLLPRNRADVFSAPTLLTEASARRPGWGKVAPRIMELSRPNLLAMPKTMAAAAKAKVFGDSPQGSGRASTSARSLDEVAAQGWPEESNGFGKTSDSRQRKRRIWAHSRTHHDVHLVCDAIPLGNSGFADARHRGASKLRATQSMPRFRP